MPNAPSNERPRIRDNKYARWAAYYSVFGFILLILIGRLLPALAQKFIIVSTVICFFIVPAIGLYQRHKYRYVEKTDMEKRIEKQVRKVSLLIILAITIPLIILYYLDAIPEGWHSSE